MGDKLTAAGWSGCDLHATESLSLLSPFCFWLCMPACSQCRLNIEVLFSLRIDVFFFLSLFSLHSHTHAGTHKTQRQYWRVMLMAIHYWKGNRLNMTGVCYGKLCSRHLYCRASLSVSTVRKSFPSSVVFVSVTVLITNCLFFFFPSR